LASNKILDALVPMAPTSRYNEARAHARWVLAQINVNEDLNISTIKSNGQWHRLSIDTLAAALEGDDPDFSPEDPRFVEAEAFCRAWMAERPNEPVVLVVNMHNFVTDWLRAEDVLLILSEVEPSEVNR
jgi:hypothetical protein